MKVRDDAHIRLAEFAVGRRHDPGFHAEYLTRQAGGTDRSAEPSHHDLCEYPALSLAYALQMQTSGHTPLSPMENCVRIGPGP